MNKFKPFCQDCILDLTLHADGTIACNCTTWNVGEPVPPAWADNFGASLDNEDGELSLIILKTSEVEAA